MARTPKVRALGAALREAREEHKLTTRDLADRIGRNHGEISRWETGERTPKPEYVAQFLTALGIIGRPYAEIMTLAYDTAASLWVASTLPAQERQLAALIQMEQHAVAITDVAPVLIPGLLQTREYAYALMSGGKLPPDEVVRRVTIRMGRRDSLTGPNPMRYTTFIGEPALHQDIGDGSVMADQLRYLLEMTQRPNITIRVMPFNDLWRPGLESPFIFIMPDDLTPLVHLELRRSGIFLHEEGMVNTYIDALQMIDRVSFPPKASVQLITDRMESLL